MIYLFIIVIFVIVYFLINIKAKSKYLIPNETYPQMENIFQNRHIILKELNNILKLNKWSRWNGYNEEQTPIFSKMTIKEIAQRMYDNEDYINTKNSAWRLFGLILNKTKLSNACLCPKTMSLINAHNIVNAGFSCLEAGFTIDKHKDYNKNIVRCHIPLIIPSGNCKLQINEDMIQWDYDSYFIFDDTMEHMAWNKTTENRIVLIIDLERN